MALGVIRFCCCDHWQFVIIFAFDSVSLNLIFICPLSQVKCIMPLWPIRWLLRRPVKSARRGMLFWHPLANSMLPGDRAWTDVTMAGSLMAVYDILLQYPECSVVEACSASEPCIVTETRLASQNQLWSLELTVLKVDSLHGPCCYYLVNLQYVMEQVLPVYNWSCEVYVYILVCKRQTVI